MSKTATLKFRCRSETYEQIKSAAEARGCPMSEMIEYILSQHLAEDRMRSIAREEMQAAIAADRDARHDALLRLAQSDGRGGWVASNRDLNMLETLTKDASQ